MLIDLMMASASWVHLRMKSGHGSVLSSWLSSVGMSSGGGSLFTSEALESLSVSLLLVVLCGVGGVVSFVCPSLVLSLVVRLCGDPTIILSICRCVLRNLFSRSTVSVQEAHP